MSARNVVAFLCAAQENRSLIPEYNVRSLSQLTLHARVAGYEFTARDLAAVIGPLEVQVILEKDGDPAINGSARLWPRMWGVHHFEYVIDHVLARFTRDELDAVVAQIEAQGGQEAPT